MTLDAYLAADRRACYPGQRVAIELDGLAYHLDREADPRRQNAVVLAGWLLLRFTARDLRERPAEVVAAVRRALEEPGVPQCRDRSPVPAPQGATRRCLTKGHP